MKSNELLLFESTTTQQPEENKSTLPLKNSSNDRVRKSTNSSRSDKSSSNESSESDNSDESSSSSSDDKCISKSKTEESVKNDKKSVSSKAPHKKQNENSTNLDLLLSLGDDVPPTLPSDVLSPSLGGLLTPLEANANDNAKSNSLEVIESAPNFISNKATELLNRISTGGLQLQYRYTRLPYIYSPLMTAVEFSFTNQGSSNLTDIRIGGRQLASKMSIHEFPAIPILSIGGTSTVALGINFNDTTQTAKFDIILTEEDGGKRCHGVSIAAPIGEMLRPIAVPETYFDTERSKLRGMNETSCKIKVKPEYAGDNKSLKQRVYETANVALVPTLDQDDNITLKFAGRTVATKSLVLISIIYQCDEPKSAEILVNCEKMVVGGLLLKDIKEMIS